jgi:hypothetical protein
VRLSQTALSNSLDCMLKGQYTIDRPAWAKRVAGSARACGTGFHAGNELYYIARRDGLTLPTLDDCIGRAIEVFQMSQTTDLYDNKPVDQFKWDEDVPDEETAKVIIEKMLTAYWPEHWPMDWQVLAVEIHGSIPDEYVGADMKVGADLVLVDPHNWLVGVDFKSAHKAWNRGKEHPRKNVQAPFYQQLLRQLYPGYAGYRFVFDIMKYPNKAGECVFDRRISDPSPAHEAAVRENAKKVVHLYQTLHVEQGLDLPANPSSTLCNPKWCDFWEGCPHGAVLDT